MHIRLLYPSLYLGAVDLHDKDVVLTIRRLVTEELKTERGSEKKPVLYFVETKKAAEKAGAPDKEKRLVLNKTNAFIIAAMHGTETNDWPGKRITLYPTKAVAFGKTVDCIRVRETVPGAAEPEPTATTVGG